MCSRHTCARWGKRVPHPKGKSNQAPSPKGGGRYNNPAAIPAQCKASPMATDRAEALFGDETQVGQPRPLVPAPIASPLGESALERKVASGDVVAYPPPLAAAQGYMCRR